MVERPDREAARTRWRVAFDERDRETAAQAVQRHAKGRRHRCR